MPPGTIIAFGGSVTPTGWLVCDGSTVSRVTYANLFNSLVTSWGSGDGVTTFHLPDLRGRFLRGVDGTANNDPDKATRTACNVGGNVGNNVGSIQADVYGSHSHSGNIMMGGNSVDMNGLNFTTSNMNMPGPNNPGTMPSGGNETRPKNAYVVYIIKY